MENLTYALDPLPPLPTAKEAGEEGLLLFILSISKNNFDPFA
jgi:hypothetical protein